MEKLHAWIEAQFDDKACITEFRIGRAISYFLNHWQKLTLFLEKAGGPRDPDSGPPARVLPLIELDLSRQPCFE